MLLDPQVNRMKFDRELELYYLNESLHKSRGWELTSVNFPLLHFSLHTQFRGTKILLLQLEINFENYNIEPLSIVIKYPTDKINLNGVIRLFDNNDKIVRIIYDNAKGNVLLLGHPITKRPFICLPGVLEYHIHTQHEKDFWDLYRYSGEGSLYNILYSLYDGAIEKVKDYLDFRLTLNGRLHAIGHLPERK